MARKFIVDGREWPDPDPTRSVDEIKGMMSTFFPEAATAEVRETKQGEDIAYEFVRRTGVKGA